MICILFFSSCEEVGILIECKIYSTAPINIKFEPQEVNPGDIITITYDYWIDKCYYYYLKFRVMPYVYATGDLIEDFSPVPNPDYQKLGKVKVNDLVKMEVKVNEDFLLKNKDKPPTGQPWRDDLVRFSDEFDKNVLWKEGFRLKSIFLTQKRYIQGNIKHFFLETNGTG